jgi:hypothetical protein
MNETVDVNFRQVFSDLVEQWHRETGFLSNSQKIVDHPCYRTLIAMGWKVVPLIIEELEKGPDFWFDALEEITGERVMIAPKEEGNLKIISAKWVALAYEKGWVEKRKTPACLSGPQGD